MRVKQFTARSLPEAVAKVRIDLGPDAVILQTRRVRPRGWFRFFDKPLVQVTAAVDPGAQPRRAERLDVEAAPATVALVQQSAPPLVSTAVTLSEGVSSLEIKDELIRVRSAMAELMDRLSLPLDPSKLEPDLRELLEGLLTRGVHPNMAVSLVNRVRNRQGKSAVESGSVMTVASHMIAKDLGKVQTVDFGRRVVALVGPTGVGKTTTVAKLAAHFSLTRRMKVGLLTVDTYRIAAVDQLRTYSEILGIPLEVVYDPAESPAALARYADRDLILIDTPGHSPQHEQHMGELQRRCEALQPDEIYLVLSLTSALGDAAKAVERYQTVGAQRLLFTKWDETGMPGLTYNLVRQFGLPLSYITTGQNVPDDIEKAEPLKIAQAIVGE